MNGNGTVYATPWGSLTLGELYDLMIAANNDRDYEELDRISVYVDMAIAEEGICQQQVRS